MTRKVSIDIAKGLGICLVVLGHLSDYFGANMPRVYSFIYLFHVPLFFFLSGLFYKEYDSFSVILKKEVFPFISPICTCKCFLFLSRNDQGIIIRE